MSGPPVDLLEKIEAEARQKQLEESNQSWKLCDVVRVNKTQVVGVIAKLINGTPWFHSAPPFRTEREVREYVARHNDKIEQTRIRKPLPELRPAVININGQVIKTRSMVELEEGVGEDGWFDEDRDYKKNPPNSKTIDEDFEIDTGSDGSTVKRYRQKAKEKK
jgi:hypothetical protein